MAIITMTDRGDNLSITPITPITYSTREDDSFGILTFDAVLDVSKNVAPYTWFYYNGYWWVGGSTCTKYLTETDTYYHSFELTEGASILKGFLLGIKKYSLSSLIDTDYKKVLSIANLMEQKYPAYAFSFLGSAELKNHNIEYSFAANTSMYDALNEIAIESELRVFVSGYAYNSTTQVTTITIGFQDVSSHTLQSLADTRITKVEYSQNSEDYGAYLETYATNVVDRTDSTTIKFLKVRADDVQLNADTAKLFLPTRIEKINSWGISFSNIDTSVNYSAQDLMYIDPRYYILIKLPDNALTAIENYLSANELTSLTYSQAITVLDNAGITYTYNGVTGNPLADYWTYYLSNFFNSEALFKNNSFEIYQPISQKYLVMSSHTAGLTMRGTIYFNNALLEKAEWDLLTPQEQAQMAVYTIGDNTIENLNGSYKTDLWNSILGNSRGNVWAKWETTFYQQWERLSTMGCIFQNNDFVNFPDRVSFMDFAFNINYDPIIDSTFITQKSGAINETSQKTLTRTYGAGANSIDFDKLLDRMGKTNASLGEPELVIEYDVSQLSTLNYPVAKNRVVYAGETWYIQSCVIVENNERKTATMNMVRNYYKNSDAVGVESQAKSTNNPLDAITTRNIFAFGNLVNINWLSKGTFFMRLRFFDENETAISVVADGTTYNTYIIPCVCMKNGSAYYFHSETIDQMMLSTYKKNTTTLIDQSIELQPIPYTKSTAEFTTMNIEVLAPLYQNDPNTSNYIQPFSLTSGMVISRKNGIKVDKDAREHLTFTLCLRTVS